MPRLIFTHHAEKRLTRRHISKQMIESAISSPDRRIDQTETPGNIKFEKTINNRAVHVIATYLVHEKSWLIISAWVRGEEDAHSLEEQIIFAPFKIIWFTLRLLWRMLAGSFDRASHHRNSR